MRTLRDLAFAATPEGVAQEIRHRLGVGFCPDCQPSAKLLFHRFGTALIVAAHGDNEEREGDARLLEREWERLGKAIDMFVGSGLPPTLQTPKGQRRGSGYRKAN